VATRHAITTRGNFAQFWCRSLWRR